MKIELPAHLLIPLHEMAAERGLCMSDMVETTLSDAVSIWAAGRVTTAAPAVPYDPEHPLRGSVSHAIEIDQPFIPEWVWDMIDYVESKRVCEVYQARATPPVQND